MQNRLQYNINYSKTVAEHPENVSAAVKNCQDNNSDNEVDAYLAQILSNSDYYPFGVSMTERSYNSTGKRYGFNGKENDEELETMCLGARLFDVDFFGGGAVDELANKYLGLSTYCFVGNMPINSIDSNGKDIYIVIKPPSANTQVKKENMEAIINRVYNTPMGNEMINKYINHPETDIFISFGFTDGDYGLTIRYVDAENKAKMVPPKCINIGGHYLYNENLPEFKHVKIDPEKRNYFVILNENYFSNKITSAKAKLGALILGHEFGAHIGNNKTEEEDHKDWGQTTIADDAPATGRAKEYNKQVEKSTTDPKEIYLEEMNIRGEYKLSKKTK